MTSELNTRPCSPAQAADRARRTLPALSLESECLGPSLAGLAYFTRRSRAVPSRAGHRDQACCAGRGLELGRTRRRRDEGRAEAFSPSPAGFQAVTMKGRARNTTMRRA